MFGIGMPELVIIMVIALIVIGPQKLPELAKSLGKGLAEFKKATDDFKTSINTETASTEEKEHLAKLADAKLQAEADKLKEAGELRAKVENVARTAEEPMLHAAKAESEKKTA
jgi:sec-independent protein translocase protein TatA